MRNLASCTSLPISGPATEIRLLPAGHFRADDGRPEEVSSWYVDASLAARIISQAAQKAGDFVIDYEHQTLNASQNGLPAPAAGWFKRLEWRDSQGLYATDVRWTATAAGMLSAREYRYISPVFTYDGKTGAVEKIINAALTNNPALDGLVDLAAATMGRSSQHADPGPGNIDQICHMLGIGRESYTVTLRSQGEKGNMNNYKKNKANSTLRQVFGPNAPQIK